MTAARSKRALAEDVWRSMVRFTLRQVQQGAHFELLRGEGLTPGHLKALAFLDGPDPRPMGVIAEGLGVDASQVTWLIDRLEERGFVERRTLPTDRRVKTVALTSKGVDYRRRLLDHLYRPPPELLALDAATLETLLDQLAKIPSPDGDVWQSFRPPGRSPGS